MVNHFKHLAEIHTDNLQTANKMLINHLQEIYLLRYGIHHKQTIKLLLQMVNIRENIFKQCFYVLIFFLLCGCLQHSNNLLTLRLTMHNNTIKVNYSLLTIISTTSLQLINHLNHFISSCKVISNIKVKSLRVYTTLSFRFTLPSNFHLKRF